MLKIGRKQVMLLVTFVRLQKREMTTIKISNTQLLTPYQPGVFKSKPVIGLIKFEGCTCYSLFFLTANSRRLQIRVSLRYFLQTDLGRRNYFFICCRKKKRRNKFRISHRKIYFLANFFEKLASCFPYYSRNCSRKP